MLARLMNDFAPLMQLQGPINGLLESFFQDVPAQRSYAARYPGVNLWTEGDTAYVEAELPGMSMSDIEIHATAHELRIDGQRTIEPPQNAGFQRRERAAGRFSRVLALPWEIDADRVRARLVDGVLTVALPRCERCKPRKIEVEASPAA